MKTGIIIYSLLALLLLSCDGMNDNIEEYLDRGEVNYLGRVDSASAIGGKERILFTWQPGKDPRIEECLITWNERQDSVIVPVDLSQIDENGYFSVVIGDFKEGTYVFNMYHLGKKGYPSIKHEVVGKVYGEKFQASLYPRGMKEIVVKDEKVKLSWGTATDSCRVMLSYPDISGKMQSLAISALEDSTLIDNYKPGGEFTYRTYYLPETNALDEFFVDSDKMQFPM